MRNITWLGSVSCMLPALWDTLSALNRVRQSSLHIGAALQNGTLPSTGRSQVVLESENCLVHKLLLRLMKLWQTPMWNRQHKWYVLSCCHGLFPLYHNALQSVVVVSVCSPHRDEFSPHLWGEERLNLWLTGSFDLTLIPSSLWKLLVFDSHSKGAFQTLEWPNETSRAQQLTFWTFIPVHLWNDDKLSPHCTGAAHQMFDSLFHQMKSCKIIESVSLIRSWKPVKQLITPHPDNCHDSPGCCSHPWQGNYY